MIQTARTPSIVIDAAIAEYGARRVLMRSLRVLFLRRKIPTPKGDALPNHLRRDIGLPPVAPPMTGWDYLR
ncbi:hypothetical protein [Palleronia sp.]|uniref:hypothetical protein n=1 Tax=Palleronia sp. TaxID=1940284 RepID=UPI0035C79023